MAKEGIATTYVTDVIIYYTFTRGAEDLLHPRSCQGLSQALSLSLYICIQLYEPMDVRLVEVLELHTKST